jgi:hypothetical protein
MWLAYQQLIQVTGSLKRHVILADGIATSLSVMFVFAAGSMAIGLIGSVLAYVREWLFREGIG